VSAATWVGVALLGGAGAVARFALDGAVQRRAAGSFPLGTLAVNAVGCLGLGLLTGFGVTGAALALAGTATIGSLTTFSTWILETERLVEDGDDRRALVNLGVSLAVGLLLTAGGWALGAAL
jgi:CrcB protein